MQYCRCRFLGKTVFWRGARADSASYHMLLLRTPPESAVGPAAGILPPARGLFISQAYSAIGELRTTKDWP